jgi:hypothetical protein
MRALPRHFGMISTILMVAGAAAGAVALQGTPPSPESQADSSPAGVMFSATGGTVTSGGLFTAGPTPGAYRVTANYRSLADTSNVSIGGPGRGHPAGIPFGAFDLQPELLAPPYSSSVLSESPDYVLRHLARARAAGARLIVNFAGGRFKNVQNVDGTFSYDLWKARVDRFLPLKDQIDEYVRDGTLLAFMMIDEPHSAPSWGGRELPYALIDQMGKYSKSIWPGLATTVRSHATWLAQAPFPWANLDAAWSQYSARKGEVVAYLAANVTASRQAGLGLITGLNVLDGGDGSSRAKGTYAGAFNMSSTEIRTYGKVLVADPYVCSFQIWKHEPEYVGRRDIADALLEVAQVGNSLSHESCQVR